MLNVTGWNKLILLDADRVFLFPRAAAGVEWFERELAAAWADLLARAARHAPVLVHGDIHEDQLLADDGRLTGVLDWETARIDHPFWDFNFGEWGTGIWRRRRRDFGTLWDRGWGAYAEVRGLDTDARPLEAAFRLRQTLALLDGSADPGVTGTVEEHLAFL